MWDEFDAWDTFACFTWSDKETDLRLQVAEEKAKSFVNDSRAWNLIRAVAKALLEREVLSRDEILKVIATERERRRPKQRPA
jgi:ATP-dependent Zn protease